MREVRADFQTISKENAELKGKLAKANQEVIELEIKLEEEEKKKEELLLKQKSEQRFISDKTTELEEKLKAKLIQNW